MIIIGLVSTSSLTVLKKGLEAIFISSKPFLYQVIQQICKIQSLFIEYTYELFDLILDMYFMAKTFWLTAVVFADLGSKYSLYFVLIFNDTLSQFSTDDNLSMIILSDKSYHISYIVRGFILNGRGVAGEAIE